MDEILDKCLRFETSPELADTIVLKIEINWKISNKGSSGLDFSFLRRAGY